MGAVISYEDDDMWISNTVCHHGSKQKLYYYKESKSFHCYTECGQLDVIGVVIGFKGYEQEEFHKAINWICVKLNLDNCEYGFGKQEQISDWEFIRKYKRNTKKEVENKPLVPYDKSIPHTSKSYIHRNGLMKVYQLKLWRSTTSCIPHGNKRLSFLILM